MDKIRFLNPEDFNKPASEEQKAPEPLKVYINKNLQLEFDYNAVKALDLQNIKGVKFFVDTESQSDDLHIVLCKELDGAFQLVSPFQEYLVIGAENIFQSFGYVCDSCYNKIPFLLTKKTINDQEVYKLEKIE